MFAYFVCLGKYTLENIPSAISHEIYHRQTGLSIPPCFHIGNSKLGLWSVSGDLEENLPSDCFCYNF